MDVSVIFVNYKTCDLLVNCIKSVYSLTSDISFEIIVVDNDSQDNSKKIVSEQFPNVIYIESSINLGFGKANNLGVDHSTGRNIFFLNTDTLLINNAIKLLSNFLDENENAAVCGGNLYDSNMNHTHSFSRIFPGIFSEIDSIFNHQISKNFNINTTQYNSLNIPLKVAYICGADMMVKKEVLNIVGLFDKDFFLYYEETELSYRIMKNNFDIFNLPNVMIKHFEGGSQNDSKSKTIFYNRSKRLFYKKRYGILNYYFIVFLFYLKCCIAIIKNTFFLNTKKITEWVNNISSFNLN